MRKKQCTYINFLIPLSKNAISLFITSEEAENKRKRKEIETNRVILYLNGEGCLDSSRLKQGVRNSVSGMQSHCFLRSSLAEICSQELKSQDKSRNSMWSWDSEPGWTPTPPGISKFYFTLRFFILYESTLVFTMCKIL